MKPFFALLGFLFVFAALPSTSLANETIELGAGLSGTDQEVDFVFRIDAEKTLLDDQFVLIKAKGDFGIGAANMNFIDFQLNLLGVQTGNEYFKFGLSLANLNIQRDIAIDNMASVRLTFIGLHASANAPLTHDIEFIANLAADFAGMGYAGRISDQTAMDGMSYGGKAEIGAEFFKKYRLVLGAQGSAINGDPETHSTGRQICHYDHGYYDHHDYDYDPYYDSYSGDYRYCYDETVTNFHQNAYTSQYYFQVSAEIADRVSLVGKAAYKVFEMTDDRGRFANSSNAGWRFMLGVSYKL